MKKSTGNCEIPQPLKYFQRWKLLLWEMLLTISIDDIIVKAKIISSYDIEEAAMAKEPLKVLTESMFYVLLSLLRQDRCGTEIVQYVDDTTAGRVSLGPGTLYTILAKFEEEGLIRETAVEGRKRTYAITDRGRALYRQELSRLRLCVADGEREEC